MQPSVDCLGRLPEIIRLLLDIGIRRINEGCDCRRGGHQLAQRSHSLPFQGDSDDIDPGGVATRAIEAGNQTKLDRIIADHEHDRNRCGCRLGRECRWRVTCEDYRDVPPYQVRSHSGHLTVVFSERYFDRDVLSLDISGFAEALAEWWKHRSLWG